MTLNPAIETPKGRIMADKFIARLKEWQAVIALAAACIAGGMAWQDVNSRMASAEKRIDLLEHKLVIDHDILVELRTHQRAMAESLQRIEKRIDSKP